MEPSGVTQPRERGADGEASAGERRARQLTEELGLAREQLRAAERSRDEWIVRFYRSRPRTLIRRAIHGVLDFAKAVTPLGLRLRYRARYLRWYQRFFPHGLREFESADLVLPLRETVLVDPVDRGPSAAAGSLEGTQVADGPSFANHPSYRPKVSVVLPVWNQTGFLGDSVRSVLAQSYDNLELIVVDDGSDADLSSGPAPWTDDPRVRVIRRPHEGIAAALNAGFREASGDFLTWTSADNLMKPGMLSALLGFLVRRPLVDMAYANIELIDEKGRPLTGSDVRVMNQRPHATHKLDLPRSTEALGLEDDNFVGSCFLYRRSAAVATGEYDGSLLGAEDYDYWLRLTEIGEVRRIDDDECFYPAFSI